MWHAPVKLISERVFTPLELGFLKQNLETVKKSSMSFTFSFAPLGFEYELEKCVLNFERFLITQFEQMSAEYRDCVLDLKSENESLQKGMDQLQRNCKTYKYEINELAVDYNRLFDKSLLSKNIELMTKNKQLEDLLQKEKFEKEQFIAYCTSLNEKLMELTEENQ
jgi:predicted RNase H-like nuclease (RuvC/YqgF family)